MSVSSTHVVLLAGGTGSRMPPLVSATSPKCLLTLANRPMIFYSLFSLTLSSFPRVTIVVSASFLDPIRVYCQSAFPNDPLVAALGLPLPMLDFVTREEEDGTADVIRNLDFIRGMDIENDDLMVLSSDYVGNVDFAAVLARHRVAKASATVALLSACKKPTEHTSDIGKQAKGKKAPKKKPSKPDSSGFSVEGYALLNEGDDRLLALFSKADVSHGSVTLRPALVQRYSSIRLRSDLIDPHIYVFNVAVLQRLLRTYANISSVKYDLVPYLARRQHTLSAVSHEWNVPLDDIAVFATVLKEGTFAKRANTVPGFHAANMDIATGALENYLLSAKDGDAEAENAQPAAKKKGKKTTPKVSPFESEGERVNVSPDSLVGPGVTAGDRASVKKSVIGASCRIASNVKVNGCVVLSDATLEEGVNLAGCIVCEGAVIGKGATLKDCRVAAGVTVDPETEGKDRDFTRTQPGVDETLDQGFEFF